MKIAYRNAELHIGNGESFVGTLITENERILSVYEGDLTERDEKSVDSITDLSGHVLIPGLVDVHTHGRVGADFTTASIDEMKRMARSYLESGVTTLMPSLASVPLAELCTASDRILSIKETQTCGADRLPRFAGVHLEGRYMNPEKRGAHALDMLALPSTEEFDVLLPHFGDRFHVSFAPELDRDGAFLRAVKRAGGTVGIAHTNATYETAMQAVENGAVSFTHTYNAMSPLHHRAGGATAAALLSDAYAELICDGIHVSPEMVSLAYRMKGSEHLVLITDSIEATGCADGFYSVGGLPCIVKNGKALTEDGHLAGSTITLFDGLLNLMRFSHIGLDEALPAATRNPACMIGLENEIGTLEAGKYADFLILESDFATRGQSERIAAVVMHGSTAYAS